MTARILIKAIRDIQAGEELTYDYNLYDGDLDDAARCSCGAVNCRGSKYSSEEITGRKRALRRSTTPLEPKTRTA